MVAEPLPSVDPKIIREIFQESIETTRAILTLPGLTEKELFRHHQEITHAQIARFDLWTLVDNNLS